ncbi:MAG: cell division protein SepF [Clostridia bacterium]
MGFMDEFKKWAHLDIDDEDEDDEFEDFVPAKKNERHTEEEVETKRGNKVVNIHTTTQLQVVLVKPERYESSPDIADHLKERRTVVLNLESANKDTARRILDFLSGVAYANDGQFKRVANSTYIITPYNVDLQGDLIDELENNGLYF